MWTDFSEYRKKYRNNNPKRKKAMAKIFAEYETDPLRELMFNELALRDDDFYRAQYKEVTDTFIDFIKRRILRPSNLIIMIEGPQGEGKSYIGLWLATVWVLMMEALIGKKPRIEFSFNAAESQAKLPKIRDGDLILQDEDSKLIGRGAATAEAELTNLVETMRYTQKSIIICAPHLKMLPGMVTALRPMGQFKTDDPDEYKSRVLVYQLEEDRPSGNKFMLLGFLIADISDIDDTLFRHYRKAKNDNYRQLEKNSGAAGAQSKIEHARLKKIARRVYKLALKRNWPRDPRNPSKKALAGFFMEAQVVLNDHQEGVVSEMIVNMFHAEHPPVRPSDPSVSVPAPPSSLPPSSPAVPLVPLFTVDENEIIAEIRREIVTVPTLERQIAIYLGSKDPLKTGNDFADQYHIGIGQVSKDKMAMEGRVNDRLGKRYERFLLPHLQQKYAQVIAHGGQGRPDLICLDTSGHYFIYSIKCYRINHARRPSFSLSWEKSHAEIEYARSLFFQQAIPVQQITVITHVLNYETQKIHEFVLDDPAVLSTRAPYNHRSYVIKKDTFTRDPALGSWV